MTSSSFPTELLEANANSAADAIHQAGTRATDLVAAWISAGNAPAVEAVARLGVGQPKKAARRGLDVLKARGIAIPRPSHVASLSVAKEKEILEARMAPPDSAGNMVFIITARTPSSRIRTAFVVLNDQQGIHSVQTGELSQTQLKDAIGRTMPEVDCKPTLVGVEWARFRIDQARRLHESRQVPLPLGFSRAAELLEPVPASEVEHPFDEEGLVLSDEDAQDQAKLSRELHRLPEFRAWLPEKGPVDELLTRVGEHLAPGEQPSQERLFKLVEQEIGAATDRYFTPERRSALLSVMKDSALSVLQREGETQALAVVGVMTVIGQAGLITDAPSEVPFLRAFFEKAVSLLLSQGRGHLRIPVSGAPKAASDADPDRRWGVAGDSEAEEAPSAVAEIAPDASATPG